MKKILCFLLLLISVQVFGQAVTGPNGYGIKQRHIWAMETFRPPILDDTTCNLIVNATNGDCYGAIMILRSDNTMYQRDSTGWRKVGSGSGEGITKVNTVEQMMAYGGSATFLNVLDSTRGGFFDLTTSPQLTDSCIIFPATGKGAGFYWRRKWDHARIMATWAGVRADGNDHSVELNRIIQKRKRSGDTTGVTIVLNDYGTYRFKDVRIEKGVIIMCDQDATNNVNAYVPVLIMPAPGADSSIFNFAPDAENAGLVGLYINADYLNFPGLYAAIRVHGERISILRTNVIFAARHAIIGEAGASHINYNNFQGMFNAPTVFSGPEDFQGAVHLTMGDSYFLNNECGAAAPYLTGQVVDPADIIRDPAFKRIVAFYAPYAGNSYIEDNLFENGDQGAVINGCIYGKFSGNRYEMNAFRGCRLKLVYSTTFTDEHFANNSLALNGQGEDLRLDTGAVAFCTFSHLVFVKLLHPAIPTSYYKVRVNITNLSGPGGNAFISPQFSDTTVAARYDSLGHFDTSPYAVAGRHALMQMNDSMPTFNALTIGGDGLRDPWRRITHRGMVELVAGQTAAGGGGAGAMRFTNEAGAFTGSIGGDAFAGLTFTSPGNATFLTAGIVHAKVGGTVLNMISDNTGFNDIQFSSDVIPTRSARIRLNNVNGDFSLTGSSHIYIGTNNNWRFNFDGSNAIPVPPTPAPAANGDTTTGFVMRTNNGGLLKLRPNVYWDTTQVKHYADSVSTAAGGQSLQSVTDVGNTTSNSIIVNKIGINTTPINHLEVDGSVGFPLFVFSADNLPFGSSDYSLGINNTGVGTVTLPDAAVYPNRICEVKKVSATGILVNIVSSGGNIDGVSTKTLNVQNSWMRFQSDGTNWRVMGQNLLDGISTTRLINTTAPLAGGGDLSADRTLSIANAVADGATKGAASFTANDFDASSGNISIDYTNGQTAGTATKGFLAAADWNTFNNKIGTLNTLTGASQTFATGTTGTDFNISSASTTHTFNIPSMAVSGATRGLLTNTTQVLPGDKSLTGVTTLASGWATGSFAFGATAPPSTARVNILSATTSGLYIINSATIGAATGGFARLMNSGTASAADQRMGGIIFGTNPSGTNFRSMGSIEMLSEAAHTDNVSQPSYMRFLTTPVSTAAAVERMRITAGGDLGLGTLVPTSPAAFRIFHINDGTSGSSPGIHITNDATGGAVGDGTVMWVGNASAAGNTSFNIYNQENSPIALFTSSTERLRVLGNGNVLIGTTTDGGQKLQVNGNVNVSAILQTVGLGVSGPASFNGGITVNNQTLTGSASLSVGGPLVISVNNTGTATITLPTAASAAGYIQFIKKISGAANNVVINVTSSGTIDGGASVTMVTQNSCYGLQSNGTEWKIITAYIGGAIL